MEKEVRKDNIIDEELIKKRKEKVVKFLKNSQWWVLAVLIIAVILGVYIRSLPMTDHSHGKIPSVFEFLTGTAFDGRPGLLDITTNTWTLGPDLDPWLFERYAKIIVEKGSLPRIDYMRNVPLGFDTTIESMLLPYMIDWTYHLLNFLGVKSNVEFAAVLFPVIMLVLTIISFFLFVREIFIRKSVKSKLKANIIALISTFFMIVNPVFLSRTVAGIPEKESAAFFFMFLAFYFFLKGWKSKNLKISILLGVLSGISTALLGLVWGGIIYVFIPIGLAGLVAFILNKVHKKEFLVYGAWIVFSYVILMFFSNKYSPIGFFTSISSGLAFLVVIIIIIHFIIWKTKLSEIKIFNKYNIPKTIISFVTAIILIFIFVLIFFGPDFIIEKLKAIHQSIFKPIQGRWNITVAENRQPDFKEWSQSFGPFFKNIPLFFWLFFIGSIVLFKKMLRKVKQKDAWILTFFYFFFLLGIIFSRYSGSSIFNGDNFISKAFYYLSGFLFAGALIYFYIKYYKKGDKSFGKIRFEYLVLFSLFIFTLFTVRGAVRLIMVLGPIASIFVGFLIVESISWFKKFKDETIKVLVIVIIVLILVGSIYCFWIYYKSVKVQAYSFIPSAYNIQWQKSMQWVRESTPENAVFGHWWDYGYWVQSIGNRATVTDGGNAIAYWNYLMGRYVLTGDNQDDALEFLYNHNTTHYLIDSTDIGKYTAFSSIGSDINYDRYSWIGTFIQDERQTQETSNQTLFVYTGGVGLDEDLVIKENGKEILLPAGSTGVGAIIVPIKKEGELGAYGQPYVIMIYQGIQHKVELRYLHINGKLVDFKSGIESAAFIFSRLDQSGNGINKKEFGAAFFISPRLFRGMLSQTYIMDDPLNKFPNFKLVNTQASLIIEDLRAQGMQLPDFVFFQGVQGPIKIWEIKYTGKEKMKKEYIDIDHRPYLDWEL